MLLIPYASASPSLPILLFRSDGREDGWGPEIENTRNQTIKRMGRKPKVLSREQNEADILSRDRARSRGIVTEVSVRHRSKMDVPCILSIMMRCEV